MDRAFIVSEIKRTAEQNGGKPLGRERFSKVTGIRQADWYGIFWSRWGDAVAEAGFVPNLLQGPLEELYLVEQLTLLTRELGRFPVEGELRIKARDDKKFPSHGAVARLGTKTDRARKVLAYCDTHPGYGDVAAICIALIDSANPKSGRSVHVAEPAFGFVYLARSGRFYKIGQTASLGRREYELAIQLPEKLTLIHSIRTDDPQGIESYWHRRFADRRKNGEWFELSALDVKAFKRRNFM